MAIADTDYSDQLWFIDWNFDFTPFGVQKIQIRKRKRRTGAVEQFQVSVLRENPLFNIFIGHEPPMCVI